MTRGPFQGVWNIVRFNWPFYLLATVAVLFLLIVRNYFSAFTMLIDVLLLVFIGSTFVSLLVSFYVYDLSGFYELRWLDGVPHREGESIVNINAGFDETSSLLKGRFRDAELLVCDFYDPAKHTERSIKRARRAYPPFPATQSVSTQQLPFKTGSVEKLFAIMSAHEIRDRNERLSFFSEINRILAPRGQAVVVEHLRDAANLLAYNVGVLHFYSRAIWLHAFDDAKLKVVDEKKITPFLTAFFLSKNGTES